MHDDGHPDRYELILLCEFSAEIEVLQIVLLRAVPLGFDVRRGEAFWLRTKLQSLDGGHISVSTRLPSITGIDAVNDLLAGVVRAVARADALDVLVGSVR